MSKLVVRACAFAELSGAPNFAALTEEYAKESRLAGLPEPKAHIAGYLALEAAGVMQTVCAFLADELIGFAIALVVVLPHYSVPVASMESFFVAASRRRTGAGLALRRAVERIAHERGAVGLLISVAVGSRLANVMKRSRSYRETNRVFFKALA